MFGETKLYLLFDCFIGETLTLNTVMSSELSSLLDRSWLATRYFVWVIHFSAMRLFDLSVLFAWLIERSVWMPLFCWGDADDDGCK